MATATFDQSQLDLLGAISLDEVALWLLTFLVPSCMATTQGAPLPLVLIKTASNAQGSTSFLAEFRQLSAGLAPACENEMLLLQHGSVLPSSIGKFIRLYVEDSIAKLELSDPSHFNTLSIEMASDAQAAVQWLLRQERISIWSVVLQGAGEHFCPGGNMHRNATAPTSIPAAAARMSIDLFDGFVRLRTLTIPVLCAAHGTVLGGGLAICLLTDYVISSDAATSYQVGERSRAIYPAGLLTQTLADGIGSEAAVAFYLSEPKLAATQACEMALVQAVTSSKNDAQQIACNLAHRHARSTCEVSCELQMDLRMLSGELPPSDRRVLATSALAQASSLQSRLLGSLSVDPVVFAGNKGMLTRTSLRGKLQVALCVSGATSLDGQALNDTDWREIEYVVDQADSCADDSLTQLLQIVKGQQGIHEDIQGESTFLKQAVDVGPLAVSFADAFTTDTGADPLDVLMTVCGHGQLV